MCLLILSIMKSFKLDEENGVNDDDDDDMDVDEENQKIKKNSHNNKIKRKMWMLNGCGRRW